MNFLRFLFVLLMIVGGRTGVYAQMPSSKPDSVSANRTYRLSLKLSKQGQLDSAYQVLHQALQQARRHNDSLLMSKIFYKLGRLDLVFGFDNLAEFHAAQALKTLPSSPTATSPVYKALPYFLLGSVFTQKKHFSKARKYMQLYRRHYQLAAPEDTLKYHLYYLNSMSIISAGENRYQEAIQRLDSILMIPEARKYKELYGKALMNKGTYLLRLGKYDEAVIPLFEGLRLLEKLNDPVKNVWGYLNLSEYYAAKHNTPQAVYYAQKARETAGGAKLYELEKDALARLMDLDSLSKVPAYMARYRELEKILEAQENRTKDYTLLSVFETAEKERALALSRYKINRFRKHLTYLALIAFFLFVTALIIAFFLQKIRHQKALIEQQKQELDRLYKNLYDLYKVMHHLVENNFGFFIILTSGIKKALTLPGTPINEALQNIIEKFRSFIEIHRMLRYDKSYDGTKPLDISLLASKIFDLMKETSGIKHVRLEKHIQPVAELGPKHFFLIGLIIQEFITNSFKYAFDERTRDGLISIRLYKEDQDIVLKMRDNGKGGRLKEKTNHTSSGTGMQLIRSLHRQLDTLSHELQEDDRFHLDTENGYGLTLRFRIG